jgi:hypothetical protein
LDIRKIIPHKNNKYLRNLIEAAFFDGKKFLLPEGMPEYKPAQGHADQTSGAFWQIAKKIDVFTRKDIPNTRREVLFIQAVESLTEVDAKILVHVKEQTLDKMFPNITKKSLTDVGYFT